MPLGSPITITDFCGKILSSSYHKNLTTKPLIIDYNLTSLFFHQLEPLTLKPSFLLSSNGVIWFKITKKPQNTKHKQI